MMKEEKHPLVSVVIPTYNRANLIPETLQSLQAQTYEHWEAIVVDDGSTDDTDAVMTAFTAEDKRIRYQKRKGQKKGANACRNLGVQASEGSSILFLDSDDLLAPHCLQQRLEVLLRNEDIDAVMATSYSFVDNKENVVRIFNPELKQGDLDALLLMNYTIPILSPLWRKDFIGKVGCWNEDLPSWQDVDFLFRAFISDVKFIKLNQPDSYIRTTVSVADDCVKTSRIQIVDPVHLIAAEALFEFIKNKLSELDMLTWQRAHYVAGLYFFLIECWIRRRHPKKAIQLWGHVLAENLIGRKLFILGYVYIGINYIGLLRFSFISRKYKMWKWHWRLAKGKIMV